MPRWSAAFSPDLPFALAVAPPNGRLSGAECLAGLCGPSFASYGAGLSCRLVFLPQAALLAATALGRRFRHSAAAFSAVFFPRAKR